MDKLLEIKNLHVSFSSYAGEVQAVRGVTFDVFKGETVAIVGESGCGKSVTAQAVMQLLPQPPAIYKEGEILFSGRNLLQMKEREMQRIRGKEMGMIFQDPMTSLNPTMKVGRQIAESLRRHQRLSRGEARKQAIEMLRLAGIPQPDQRVDQFPFEFSGGMRQRAMIAVALACQPQLLIADEPTTALDVTIQAQILQLMKQVQKKTGTSIILITHDLGVVAGTCDRVIVMYAGEVVEQGTVKEIFNHPQHPYTKGLLRSVARLDMDREAPLIPIHGSPPDLLYPPNGCGFFERCEHAMEICRQHRPDLQSENNGHRVRCWLNHPQAKGVI